MTELVVHARTKADGYRAPAYWERIQPLQAALKIPVIANGEIWNLADALRCRELSGCQRLMLGRGMVANPGLALAIKAHALKNLNAESVTEKSIDWPYLLPLMLLFWKQVSRRVVPRHRGGRLKQWLHFLRRQYPQAEHAFAALRTVNDPILLEHWLHTECVRYAVAVPVSLVNEYGNP